MAHVAERHETYTTSFDAFRRTPAFGQGPLADAREAAFGRFLRGVDVAEVSEHHVDRKIGKLPVEVRELVDVHQELDVPAERLHLYREPAQVVERQDAPAFLEVDDVDPHAAHARLVQRLELSRVDVVRHHCYPAQALVDAAPERLFWGTDWPHVFIKTAMPEDKSLLGLLEHWVPERAMRKRILVDQPAQLYGFTRP